MGTKEHESAPLPGYISAARFCRETGLGRKLFNKELAAGRIIARRTDSGRIFVSSDEIRAWFNRLEKVAA